MTTRFVLGKIPAEDEALRAPVRAFLQDAVRSLPPERRARTWMGFDADFSRALAAQGWVGLTLPTAYGGAGRSQFARFVLVEELLAFGAPVAAHWIAERQTAPLLLKYGTEAQKQKIIPSICRGEFYACIGMSEPDAGSDLASVRSRAELTPQGWRLNGGKIWTTYGQRAHYMLALVRTSERTEDRHTGLSQLLVDLSAPGVTTRPIRDLAGDEHFSEVHFDNVLLPHDAIVGREGAGWEQVNAELAFERSGPERLQSCTVLIDEWLTYLRERGGVSTVEATLAGEILAELASLRQMSLSVTAQLAEGEGPVLAATMVKDLGTSFEQSIPERIGHHLATEPAESLPGPLLATLDYLAAMSPSFSLRGGTREILRGIIAKGLGLR